MRITMLLLVLGALVMLDLFFPRRRRWTVVTGSDQFSAADIGLITEIAGGPARVVRVVNPRVIECQACGTSEQLVASVRVWLGHVGVLTRLDPAPCRFVEDSSSLKEVEG
jgi:hypothetical protein